LGFESVEINSLVIASQNNTNRKGYNLLYSQVKGVPVKSALITGVLGQDGIFLSKLLIEKGYVVHGTYSPWSTEALQFMRGHLAGVSLHQVRLTSDITDVIDQINPDEIYNLSALSSVAESFLSPVRTAESNALRYLEILEHVKKNARNSKIYQASSSEMFGTPEVCPQTESTTFNPKSPYASSKCFAHNLGINYRETYDMFISNGILYNHESELRSNRFVTRKITQGIARIALGIDKKIYLGDLAIRRDWGYAGDYVEAMWLMLQQESPNDYIIATNQSRSLREYLESCLRLVGLEGEADRYVETNSSFIRRNEITNLQGDYSKAKAELDWKPKTQFEDWLLRMLENDLKIESNR
jgi:GDPmannose 4,6-dehydratase